MYNIKILNDDIMEGILSMNSFKKYMNHIFIDGLSGMALGLFATLIVGTIVAQIGTLIGGTIGEQITILSSIAKSLTGAGIGIGIAYKFKELPLVAISAAVSGIIGAFASKILAGAVLVNGAIVLSGPGEPLGAFIAAFTAIEIGHHVSGKTKIDILITPLVTITVGSIVGLLIGPPISTFMTMLSELINWGTVQQPVLMGIIVSVIMGISLTLPISSAALGVILGLSGIAAGAATVGCCAQMVGFAVSSFRENKVSGLIAQGIGTSMLQIPNIMKKPVIWLPPIITSAILGPISSKVLMMTNNPTGSGMGTSGLVGPIMAYQTMTSEGVNTFSALFQISIMHFIAPALISFIISEFMRKKGWIHFGDMTLDA